MKRRQANLNKSFFNLKLIIAILLSLFLALVIAIVPGNIAFFQSGNQDVSPPVIESTGIIKNQESYEVEQGSQSSVLKLNVDGVQASKLFIENQEIPKVIK